MRGKGKGRKERGRGVDKGIRGGVLGGKTGDEIDYKFNNHRNKERRVANIQEE